MHSYGSWRIEPAKRLQRNKRSRAERLSIVASWTFLPFDNIAQVSHVAIDAFAFRKKWPEAV